jgi:predicted nuclease with TOPRIM domain
MSSAYQRTQSLAYDEYSNRSFSYKDKDSDDGRTKNSFSSSTRQSFNTKGSFGSDQSFEYFNVDGDEDGQFSLKGTDGKSVLASLDDSGQGDDFDQLSAETIFQRLYPREQFKNQSECICCQTKFSALKLKKRRHCKFCGNSICDDHGKKKRPDPQNTTATYRICDKCDVKYLLRIILGEYHERSKKKDKELAAYEKSMREYQIKSADANREHDSLKLKKNKLDKGYSDEVMFLTGEINRIKDETKKCEKENAVLNKEFNETHVKVEEIETQYNDAKTEHERLKKEASTLNHQIDAINADINQLNRSLKSMDEMISKGKMNRFSNDVNQNTFYAGSLLGNNESIMESGDSVLSSSDIRKPPTNNSHYKPIMKKSGVKPKGDEKADKGSSCNMCNIF